MILFDSLETPLDSSDELIALSIGNFDGVHLGHQKIIQTMKETPASRYGIVTFSNHPSEVITGKEPPTPLCSHEERRAKLEQCGIHFLYEIPFTEELSLMTPRDFLRKLKEAIPFSYLVLGEDAVLGHKRSGTPDVIRGLTGEFSFEVIYVPDLIIEGRRLSSSFLRQLKNGSTTEEVQHT